jgi:hypothetical protein
MVFLAAPHGWHTAHREAYFRIGELAVALRPRLTV